MHSDTKMAGSFTCSITPWLSVRGGARAVEFYKAAFGAVEVYRIEDPDGNVVARLSVDSAEFWLSDESPQHGNPSPELTGGASVRLILTVADPDQMFERALKAGATQVYPISEGHGWRVGRVVDPYGHHWEIGRPLAQSSSTSAAPVSAWTAIPDLPRQQNGSRELSFLQKGILMRTCLCAVLLAVLTLSGCGRQPDGATAVTAVQAALVEDGVRAFMRAVAHDVTQEGPAGWPRHFAGGPAFFMASEGRLVFADGASAAKATHDLALEFKHIELDWGAGLRVDPLTPNLAVVAAPWHEVRVNAAGVRVEDAGFFTAVAEYRDGSWKLRDAHWSVAAPDAVSR